MTRHNDVPSAPTMLAALSEMKDKLITVDVPQNAISHEGAIEVEDFLRSNALPTLPHDWDWNWTVAKGKYAGNFPKRVANYLYKEHGVKMETNTSAQLGNIARKHSEDMTSYHIDFTNRIDWQPGAFGDFHSCFWSERPEAIDMLLKHGAWAVRFYEAPEKAFKLSIGHNITCNCGDCGRSYMDLYDKYNREGMNTKDDMLGFGRTWLVPDLPHEWCAVLFNAYPKNFRLIRVARILSQFLGTSYQRIKLFNLGEWRSRKTVMYINNNTGYMIGSASSLEGMDRFDFMWKPRNYQRVQMYTCDYCSNDYPNLSIAYDTHRRLNGEEYQACSECIANYHTTCGWCSYIIHGNNNNNEADIERDFHRNFTLIASYRTRSAVQFRTAGKRFYLRPDSDWACCKTCMSRVEKSGGGISQCKECQKYYSTITVKSLNKYGFFEDGVCGMCRQHAQETLINQTLVNEPQELEAVVSGIKNRLIYVPEIDDKQQEVEYAEALKWMNDLLSTNPVETIDVNRAQQSVMDMYGNLVEPEGDDHDNE